MMKDFTADHFVWTLAIVCGALFLAFVVDRSCVSDDARRAQSHAETIKRIEHVCPVEVAP